jgi:tetratricopeptide (TPR) repeat protein
MAQAHAHLAYVDSEYGLDWDRAEREFRLALQEGNRAECHKLYAMSLAERGRFVESHEHMRIAEDLAPLDSDLLFYEGAVLAWEHRFPDAELKYQAMLQRNPNATIALAPLAHIKTWENDCAGAAQYLDRLARLSPNDYRTGSVRVAVAVCRGDKEGALKYLELAVERHDFGAPTMKQAPYLDSLHGDPRFIALERRVGLDP